MSYISYNSFLIHQEELSKLSEISNSLAVFCMATYGEGDPTDNAQAFYEWLQAGDADLTGVNYAVSLPSQFKLFLLDRFTRIFKGLWPGQQNVRALQRHGQICR